MVQVTPQPDNNSCGIIVLKCIEEVMKFACRCDFNFLELVDISEAKIHYLSKAVDIASYRNHVGRLLNALYVSALRYENDSEGMIVSFTRTNYY
jgi:hypothetical protein